jgi:hypothetical protein
MWFIIPGLPSGVSASVETPLGFRSGRVTQLGIPRFRSRVDYRSAGSPAVSGWTTFSRFNVV